MYGALDQSKSSVSMYGTSSHEDKENYHGLQKPPLAFRWPTVARKLAYCALSLHREIAPLKSLKSVHKAQHVKSRLHSLLSGSNYYI